MPLINRCADKGFKGLGPCSGRVVYGPDPADALRGSTKKIYLCASHAKKRLASRH